MSEWYYQEGASSVGPVSLSDLRTLMLKGKVKLDTLVWTKDFGADWRRASETELSSSLPPPLPGKTQAAPSPRTSTAPKKPTNALIWIAALAPILSFAFAIIVPVQNEGTAFFFVAHQYIAYLLTVVTVLAIDAFLIGTSEERGRLWIGLSWGTFIIPLYLLVRAKFLKSGYAALAVWCVSFAGLQILIHYVRSTVL